VSLSPFTPSRGLGFDSDQNGVLMISRDGLVTRIARGPKLVIANRLLDVVVSRLS
jgi:phosphopantothenoylcysteine synthetase/decarboxylase